MKNALRARLILFSFLFSISTYTANAQGWQWAVGASCPKADCEGGPIAVDQHGNVYACGILYQGLPAVYPLQNIFGTDTLTDSSGLGYQMIVTSTDSAGNPRWQIGAQYGQIWVADIKVDPYGNVYILGNSGTSSFYFGGIYFSSSWSSTSFCAKVTSAGTVLWIREIAEIQPYRFAINNSGDMYFTGYYEVNCTVGSSTIYDTSSSFLSNVFLAKYDSALTPVWAIGFGGDSADIGLGIAVTTSDQVYVTGTYNSQSMPIGTYTLSSASSAPGLNIFTAKFSNAGGLLWAKSVVADTANDNVAGCSTDNLGNIYVTGTYLGNISFGPYAMPPSPVYQRFFLWKYDALGNEQWARTLQDNSMFFANAVSADNCGNVWLLGQSDNSGPFMLDPMFMVHYDSAGNFIDSLFIGAGGDDGGYMTVDKKGSVYVSSDYYGDTYFGSHLLLLRDSSQEALYVGKYVYDLSACVPDTIPLHSDEPALKQSISIYPNPATTQLTIASGNEPITEISICNIMGQVVYSGHGSAPLTMTTPGIQLSVDVSEWPSGVYFVKVNGVVRKFVKE